MLKLAGIPVSDLTKLTDTQRNSDEFQKALEAFNSGKTSDTSESISDNDSDIPEEDIILLRNILILMVDYERNDLPITRNRDRIIYFKLIIGNIANLFTNMDNAIDESMGLIKNKNNYEETFEFIPPEKDYFIYKEKTLPWYNQITFHRLNMVNYNPDKDYSGDIFLSFAQFSRFEMQFPIFANEQKSIVLAINDYHERVFSKNSKSVYTRLYGNNAPLDVKRIKYTYNSIDLNALSRKLSKNITSFSNDYNKIITKDAIFNSYFKELYYDFDCTNNIKDIDKDMFRVNIDTIYDVIDKIDIMEEWYYG